jgi:hypothetical protein
MKPKDFDKMVDNDQFSSNVAIKKEQNVSENIDKICETYVFC